MTDNWVARGLLHGIATESLAADAPGSRAGLPVLHRPATREETSTLAALCPTGALKETPGGVSVRPDRCIRCERCLFPDSPVSMSEDAARPSWHEGHPRPFPKRYQRSLHIRVVDAGDCGACLNEVRQLNNPFYNMHRFGFFITPTPRHADVLLAVGSGTLHMRRVLEETFAAMPEPRRVVAVGQCALHGGLWSESLTGGHGISALLPVDLDIPGAPPSPRAILDGLLMLSGRKLIGEDVSRQGRESGR